MVLGLPLRYPVFLCTIFVFYLLSSQQTILVTKEVKFSESFKIFILCQIQFASENDRSLVFKKSLSLVVLKLLFNLTLLPLCPCSFHDMSIVISYRHDPNVIRFPESPNRNRLLDFSPDVKVSKRVERSLFGVVDIVPLHGFEKSNHSLLNQVRELQATVGVNLGV